MGRVILRNLTLAVVAAFMLAAPASSQNDKELARLREFLALPASSALATEDGRALPAARPIKVYVATDDEPTCAAEVEKLVAETNKTGASAAIVLVATRAQADVVLVQFEMREKRRIELDNRLTMDPTMGTRASGGRSDPVYRTEIRGYVLVREGDGYAVLEGFKKSVVLGGKRTELKSAFERALKRPSRE
jgi:hypothetical protein